MKGFISKFWKGVALFLICVMVGVTIIPYFVLENNADARKKQSFELTSQTASGNSSVKGTEDNPFTILEIAPYHSMAQMLWLSGQTMPKLESDNVWRYYDAAGQSSFATGLSGMCDLESWQDTNKSFSDKTPFMNKPSYDSNVLSQVKLYYNKEQKQYNNNDFKDILTMFGYTGSTYFNGENLTEEGRNKAISLIEDFRRNKNKGSFDITSSDWYETQLEKIYNHELFKRFIIGIETRVIKEEWAKGKLIDEGNSNPSAAEIQEKIATFSRVDNAAEYNTIKAQTSTKEKVLDECDKYHVRVIVATPDEVNKSVANPSVKVDTVAVFPEKKIDGVYQTYTANPNKSLIDMADLVFMVNTYTNKESGMMYDCFTKDAQRRDDLGYYITERCPGYSLSGAQYQAKVNNHYKFDLSGKASVELFTRMIGGATGSQKRLPVIINKTCLEVNGESGDAFNTKTSTNNISRLFILELVYNFDAEGFSAAGLLGRLSYNTGAAYQGAGSASSDSAYEFKFDGNVKWGGGTFYSSTGSPTPVNGAHYLPYNSPSYKSGAGIFNASVFLYNSDENFNKQILSARYEDNSEGVFKTANEYLASNQIIGSPSGKLTPADIIRSIVGDQGAIPPLPHSKLRVLEVQPCASFEKEEFEGNADEHKAKLEEAYRKLLPNYTGPIVIDQMSSLEFNGITEDIIESYDFIYFGLRTQKMNTDASTGNTVYNDSSLNGKIYLHTGDFISTNTGSNGTGGNSGVKHVQLLRGVLSITNNGQLTDAGDDGTDAADVYRYAGNDISARREKELEDYVKAGHCIVFDEGFFKYDADNNIVAGAANDIKIDNTSNMYKIVRYCTASNTESAGYKYLNSKVFKINFETGGGIGSNLETALAYAPYIEIRMIQREPEYALGSAFSGGSSSGYVSAAEGIKRVTNESRELNFTFEIYTANISGNFTAELYVDKFHDGGFNIGEDDTAHKSGIYRGDALTNTAPYGGATNMQITLSEDYLGMVPWKLLVYEETTDPDMQRLNRASTIGFTSVKRPSGEVETINVLQIVSNRGDYHNNTVNLLTSDQFKKFAADDVLGPAVGYNINITQVGIDELMTSPEFFADITSASELDDETNPFFAVDGNNKNLYDMLLLGFDDGYGSFDYKLDNDKQDILYTAIDQYINRGYAVLLSHDMLSLYNHWSTTLDAPGYYTGYYKNYRLREILAADRYGAYLNEEARVAKGKDVPLKAGSADSAHPAGTAIENRADWMAAGRHGKEPRQLYNHTQMQGFTDSTLDTIAGRLGISRYNKLSTNYSGSLSFPHGTTSVEQTNKGQVTLFPYVIDTGYDNSSFPVANTHCQYYQLDMERDDLVVWYTLGGSYYNYNGPDPRNNYYIYNTKNITYTGMGHSGGVSDKEVKLFINTMIAAYRAAQIPPYAILTNEGAATAASGSETQYLYVDYDTFDSMSGSSSTTIISADLAKDPETNENCIKLRYSILDNNMLVNKKIYISPMVFSHSTRGNVLRNIRLGTYTSAGEHIYQTIYHSISNYNSSVLTSGTAIALWTEGVRTNVYKCDANGNPTEQVNFQNITIGNDTETIPAIPVDYAMSLSSNPQEYCTFIPLKYFEEEGEVYNDIYVSLSCMLVHGLAEDRRVLYGNGNMVNISKRQLFDLH